MCRLLHVSIIMKRIRVYCFIFVGQYDYFLCNKQLEQYIDAWKYEIISRVDQISWSTLEIDFIFPHIHVLFSEILVGGQNAPLIDFFQELVNGLTLGLVFRISTAHQSFYISICISTLPTQHTIKIWSTNKNYYTITHK